MIREAAAVALALSVPAVSARAQTSPSSLRMDWFKPLAGRTWKATLPNGALDVNRFGRLLVKTQQRKNGEWTPGAERTYVEDPKAEVRFR